MLFERSHVVFFPAEKMIYTEGTQAKAFYIVFNGRVDILKEKNKKILYKNTIKASFSFGEDFLSTPQSRQTSARAAEDTILIKMDEEALLSIAAKNQTFQQSLMQQYTSYQFLLNSRLVRIEDETLCFICRPHPVNVILRMAAILFGFLATGIIILMQRGAFTPQVLSWILGILSAAGTGWMVWTYLDWSNDTFFITDKRASSSRRSYLLFEERRESPLSAIESVQVRKHVLGRAFAFGDLDINTYTGSTRVANVPQVENAHALLQFLVHRRRSAEDEEALETFKSELETRIDKPGWKAFPPPQEIEGASEDREESEAMARNSTESASGSEIILHKHFTVLISKTFIPALLLLSHILLFLFLKLNAFKIANHPIFQWVMAIDSSILFMWLIYRFADWRNDRFIISRGTLTDIDRRPFGMEEKRTAPIERIQSVRYKKNGIFGLIFNFGTVFIRIGDEEFTFDDLHRPAEVSQVIFEAKETLLDAERSQKQTAERRRALDWIEAYHQLQKQEKNKNGDNHPRVS